MGDRPCQHSNFYLGFSVVFGVLTLTLTTIIVIP